MRNRPVSRLATAAEGDSSMLFQVRLRALECNYKLSGHAGRVNRRADERPVVAEWSRTLWQGSCRCRSRRRRQQFEVPQ